MSDIGRRSTRYCDLIRYKGEDWMSGTMAILQPDRPVLGSSLDRIYIPSASRSHRME